MDVAKVLADTIGSSSGLLRLDHDRDNPEQAHPPNHDHERFCLANVLFVPGIKHLIDNVIGDILGRLSGFEKFQSQLKTCTVTHLT